MARCISRETQCKLIFHLLTPSFRDWVDDDGTGLVQSFTLASRIIINPMVAGSLESCLHDVQGATGRW